VGGGVEDGGQKEVQRICHEETPMTRENRDGDQNKVLAGTSEGKKDDSEKRIKREGTEKI